MSKKKIAVILAATMIMPQAGVLAQEVSELPAEGSTVAQPRYTAISFTDYSFTIGGGIASCFGKTTVRDGYKAKTIVELQKKGISWTTTKTWTKTGTSTTAIVDEDYAVTSGTYTLTAEYHGVQATGETITLTVS